MTKYLLLYSAGNMPETDEQKDAVMQAWEAWFAKLGAALVDGGNPFTPSAMKVSAGGVISQATIMASGYSIIEAESLDNALELAKGCPVLLDGLEVTVFETFNVM